MKITGPDQNFINKKDRIGESKSSKGKSSPDSVKKDSGASAATSEKIAVSDLGKEVAKIHEQIKKAPDVRVEKVAELKEKIDDGSYYVSSDKIAGKIIDDILNNV